MQHLKNTANDQNIEHITSGGGGRGLYGFDPIACAATEADGITSLIHSETHGFAAVNIQDKTMTVTYINENGEEFYTFTRNKP